MYRRAELDAAFEYLWSATRDRLRAEGIAAPAALSDPGDDLIAFWQRPDLLLGQTCGMPFRHVLHHRVTLVGTPDFGLEGCPPGEYRSALVVRRDDPRPDLTAFRGAVLACNDRLSQSGYAAPLVAAQAAGLRFGAIRISGAHGASARMVAEGQADIAGVDVLSWRHMTAFDPWVGDLRVLGWTEPTPGLPFITAIAPLAPVLHRCLAGAIRSMPAPLRAQLGLRALVRIEASAYLTVADPPAEAVVPDGG